jgi:branched-subunit amino acid ABC-type transport system permease component
MISLDLLFEAVIFGVLLGSFYAAVSLGLSVAFGLLDVPYVAHPALLVLGAYCIYLLGTLGLDPIVSGILLAVIKLDINDLSYLEKSRSLHTALPLTSSPLYISTLLSKWIFPSPHLPE